MIAYRVSPERARVATGEALPQRMFLILVALIVGLYIGFHNSRPSSMTALLIAIPIALGALGIGLYVGTKRLRTTWMSYELELGENVVVRRQAGLPDVEIHRSGVSAIKENPRNGIMIEADDPQACIFIPRALNHYEELRERLLEWKVFEDLPSRTRQSYMPLVAGLGVVLLVVAVYASDHALIVFPAGTLLVLAMVWSLIAIQRNPTIDKQTKRTSWLILSPILTVVLRLLALMQESYRVA